MTWKIRHQGSPRSVEAPTAQQVVEGLQDGLWEPTDEVMGPADSDWVAIENHAQFAEAAAEIEAPPAPVHPDETTLDMNPLIDVCLVLLIFFILTTSYAALQKILDMPGVTANKEKGVPQMSKAEVSKFTIHVEARQENGRPVIRVEGKAADPSDLVQVLQGFMGGSGKRELLLDASPDVDWGTIVAIQDAAKGAGVSRVHFQVNPGEIK
jgi:biopolymer transport protein ExbD